MVLDHILDSSERLGRGTTLNGQKSSRKIE